jgi:hypothetical protein
MGRMRWTRSPAVIGIFVLLDLVVLVFAWVLMHRDIGTPSGGSTTSTGSPDAAQAADPPIEGPLFLASSPTGGLARVTRGSCDSREPATSRVWVARSFEASLKKVTVPGLQESLGVTMTGSRVTIVGAGPTCKLSGFVSTDAGRSWRRTAIPKDIWYLDTDTSLEAVHGPIAGGVANLDCAPVSVTTLPGGVRALVACTDFNVVEVSAKRDTSPITYVVTEPAGVAQPTSGNPLVLAALPTCGAAVVRITSQQDATSLACLGNAGAPLGLAISGNRIFAQVGFRLVVSNNLGVNFATYPGESGKG